MIVTLLSFAFVPLLLTLSAIPTLANPINLDAREAFAPPNQLLEYKHETAGKNHHGSEATRTGSDVVAQTANPNATAYATQSAVVARAAIVDPAPVYIEERHHHRQSEARTTSTQQTTLVPAETPSQVNATASVTASVVARAVIVAPPALIVPRHHHRPTTTSTKHTSSQHTESGNTSPASVAPASESNPAPTGTSNSSTSLTSTSTSATLAARDAMVGPPIYYPHHATTTRKTTTTPSTSSIMSVKPVALTPSTTGIDYVTASTQPNGVAAREAVPTVKPRAAKPEPEPNPAPEPKKTTLQKTTKIKPASTHGKAATATAKGGNGAASKTSSAAAHQSTKVGARAAKPEAEADPIFMPFVADYIPKKAKTASDGEIGGAVRTTDVQPIATQSEPAKLRARDPSFPGLVAKGNLPHGEVVHTATATPTAR